MENIKRAWIQEKWVYRCTNCNKDVVIYGHVLFGEILVCTHCQAKYKVIK